MVYILCGLIVCFYFIWRETYIKNIDKSKLKIIEYFKVRNSTVYRLHYGKTILYYIDNNPDTWERKLKDFTLLSDAKRMYEDVLNENFKIKRKGKLVPIIKKYTVKVR